MNTIPLDFVDRFRHTGRPVSLDKAPTKSRGPFENKQAGEAYVHECLERLRELQYRLFVESKQSLLVVLQAPDAAGKDGVIRKVLGRINAQGITTHSFKVPTERELRHDFLWRIHQHTPPAGRIAIFNRSHYEDVLVVRVKNLVRKSIWEKRFQHINHFESLLADSGTRVIKIYLHISRHEQLERFKERLDRPEKHWKLNVADYEARDEAGLYRSAYEDVFQKCASKEAPWYIIPSDRKWFRNCAMAAIMIKTLESMNPQLPEVDVDLDDIRQLYERELAESESDSVEDA